MIIERCLRLIGGAAQALAWRIGKAALVIGAWSAVMLAMPLVGPTGRMVAVVGDGPETVRQIVAAGGRLVEIRGGVTLARGGAGFAANLYRAGAPLVLEGRIAGGCGGGAKAGA